MPKKIWVRTTRVQRAFFEMEVPDNASPNRIDTLAEIAADKELAEEDFEVEVDWESSKQMSIHGDI